MGYYVVTPDSGSTSTTQASDEIGIGGSVGVDINVGTNVTELLNSNCDSQSGPGGASVVLGAEFGLESSATGCGPTESTVGADVGITGDLQDVKLPGILDVTVGGAELGHLLDRSACATGYDTPALEVDVLNSGHLLDVHVSGVADATVNLGDFNWNSDCGC